MKLDVFVDVPSHPSPLVVLYSRVECSSIATQELCYDTG